LTSKPTERTEAGEWRYALRLLGVRDRSEHEVRQRLAQRGLESDGIERIVQRLYRYRYLDDSRFAEGVAQRGARRGHGRIRVRSELAAKGIDKTVAEEAIASTFVDEETLARQALHKRYKTTPTDDAARARAARFLLQRGFPQRLVLAILKEGC
jgi:regulatory protein